MIENKDKKQQQKSGRRLEGKTNKKKCSSDKGREGGRHGEKEKEEIKIG